MKSLRSFLFNVSLCALSLCDSITFLQAQSTSISLNQNWQFRKAGDSLWYNATVPGTVHTDLYSNHIISDPYYGDNEMEQQWIENEDWEYRTFFTCGEEFLQNKHIELQFDGLDTYADVYLNDSLILSADNMFRQWTVDVKQLVKPDFNKLIIHFYSAVKKGKELAARLPYTLPGDEGGKAFERKAQYQFGWDWGPRFVTCGIWKNVRLISFDEFMERKIQINKLINKMFQVLGDTVWSFNGGGEDTFWLLHPCKLIQQPDSLGTSFYFKLNGVPVFMKGADVIPPDNFLPRVTVDDYKLLIDDAVECHMNMLRVWGGGAYLPDEFYDYCDEKGILIWQDFMFANTMVPGDSAFVENVRQEAIQQITRLRNHPCIALWCGNNEVDEGWHNWGWQFKDAVMLGANKKMWSNYQTIFDTLLRNMVNEYDPGATYISSSPQYGWGNDEAFKSGDSHYWGVWWGGAPFEKYEEKIGRFMSEYGFQGMPNMTTIESFTQPNDRLKIPDSKSSATEVMDIHEKHPRGWEIINDYMKRDYQVPTDFENYVYVSQLLQRDGISMAIQAHRRAKPYCMGTLYWQLNDCWPVTSWSSRDYYDVWKALQYQVKKDYQTFLISMKEENDSLSVYVVSDSLQNVNVHLHIELPNFESQSKHRSFLDTSFVMPANSSIIVAKIPMKNLPVGEEAKMHVLQAKLTNDNGDLLAERNHFFVAPKDLELPEVNLQHNIKYLGIDSSRMGFPFEYSININSDHFAKDIFVDYEFEDVKFSDNFFDLLPGEEKTITMYAASAIDYVNVPLKVKSLRDTY